MANRTYQKPSPETQQEAAKIAGAIQRPHQTKEQTKLIAQGIQKGIELYKKQHKEKSRDLNRKLKKASEKENRSVAPGDQAVNERIVYRQHWLPWLLLILTWLGMGIFYFLG